LYAKPAKVASKDDMMPSSISSFLRSRRLSVSVVVKMQYSPW
jgi:hypothetical protein